MRYRILFSYSRLLARSKSISIPSTPRSSPGTDLFTFFFRGKNTRRRRRRSRVRNYRRANNSISASRGFDGGIFNWSIRIVTRVTFSKDWRATSEETVGSVEGVHGESAVMEQHAKLRPISGETAIMINWNRWVDVLQLVLRGGA